MSEYVNGGFGMTMNTIRLQVNYRWDCQGDEPAWWKVYLASDVKQETDIWPLLSGKQVDEIYERIAEDAREMMRGKV